MSHIFYVSQKPYILLPYTSIGTLRERVRCLRRVGKGWGDRWCLWRVGFDEQLTGMHLG
jgi:hypothetical protein